MMSYAVATLVIVIYIIANYGVKWEEGQPIRLVCGLCSSEYNHVVIFANIAEVRNKVYVLIRRYGWCLPVCWVQ